MIVIDVDWNLMRQIHKDTTSRFFHIRRKKFIEVYCVDNGMLFRNIRPIAESPEQAALEFDMDLKDSLEVKRITQVGGPEWAKWGDEVLTILRELREKVDR